MTLYTSLLYPLVLAVLLVVSVAAAAAYVTPRAHPALKRAVTATYIAVAVQALVVGALLTAGADVPLVTSVGYIVVSLVLLPLMGIARIADPDPKRPDPNRPVLNAVQIAKVDAVAALVIAVALAVVAWRLSQILGAA